MKPEYDEERADELSLRYVNTWCHSVRTPMQDSYVAGYEEGFEDGYQRGREDALAEAFPKPGPAGLTPGARCVYDRLMKATQAYRKNMPAEDPYSFETYAKKYGGGCPKATDE